MFNHEPHLLYIFINYDIPMSLTSINAKNAIKQLMLLLQERFATFLAGRPCVSKVTRAKSHQRNHNNHMSMSSKPPVNGIDTIE